MLHRLPRGLDFSLRDIAPTLVRIGIQAYRSVACQCDGSTAQADYSIDSRISGFSRDWAHAHKLFKARGHESIPKPTLDEFNYSKKS